MLCGSKLHVLRAAAQVGRKGSGVRVGRVTASSHAAVGLALREHAALRADELFGQLSAEAVTREWIHR
jgi:hypothetical protein